MSGSNRLINNENVDSSFEQQASDLNDANTVAAEISDAKDSD